MTRDEYERFYDALVHAESATVHDFDKERFFEGCLPIEVMAHRGADTLRFGPMKPVGLTDPRTGRSPYAAVQLRQDNLAGDHFSLVGFQTQIKWGEQARVLRLIPGLEEAEFVRFGMVHRNTYVNGPTVLAETWQVRRAPDAVFRRTDVRRRRLRRIGGLGAARRTQCRGARQRASRSRAPPRTTAIGALAYYVSHANPAHYEPSNITFGIMAAAGASRREARWSASSRWPTRALDALPTGCGEPRGMIEHLKEFLQFLALNRNVVGAHGARLRQRSVAVHRPRRAAAAGVKRRDLTPARSIASAIRALSGRRCTPGQSRATRGAQAGGDAHVPPLSAP